MFSLFALQFHWYGFLIGIGIVLSVIIAEKILKGLLSDQEVTVISLVTIGSGLIGARTYHLITDWQLYQSQSISSWFMLWNGGLGIYGAIVGGTMGLVISTWLLKRLSLLPNLLDAIAISLPVGQAVGRIGNFFNHELYGLPTDLPWGINIPPEYRSPQFSHLSTFHPLFLYELIPLLIGFGWLYRNYQQKKRSIGQLWYLGMYLIWYSVIRWTLEWLRIDSARAGEGVLAIFPIAQWISLGLALVGVFFLTQGSRLLKNYVQK